MNFRTSLQGWIVEVLTFVVHQGRWGSHVV